MSDAGPAVVVGFLDQAGADRVLADVLERCLEVIVGVDHPAREAVSEEVARPLVAAVVALGVDAVQALYP